MRTGPRGLYWIAGYASTIAGVLTLAYFPAALAGGRLPATLIGLSGLAQVVWGAAYILRQGRWLVDLGLIVQSASLAAALLGALPEWGLPLPAWPTVAGLRLLTGLIALAAILGAPSAERDSASSRRWIGIVRAAGFSLGGALLVTVLWLATAGTRLPSWVVSPQAEPDITATPGPGTHSETGDSHSGTFRVRITRQRAGPFLVDAFTGPVEVGNLFVEVRVSDEAGKPIEGLIVKVEAHPLGDDGGPVAGTATPELAEIPGDYAVRLPVASDGFWEVVVRIGDAATPPDVSFTERVGGTANVAGWVLAGVPLAVAALFGLVYLRTAGRGRT